MKVLSLSFFFPLSQHISRPTPTHRALLNGKSVYIYIHKLIIVYPCGIVLDAFVERGISEG